MHTSSRLSQLGINFIPAHQPHAPLCIYSCPAFMPSGWYFLGHIFKVILTSQAITVQECCVHLQVA